MNSDYIFDIDSYIKNSPLFTMVDRDIKHSLKRSLLAYDEHALKLIFTKFDFIVGRIEERYDENGWYDYLDQIDSLECVHTFFQNVTSLSRSRVLLDSILRYIHDYNMRQTQMQLALTKPQIFVSADEDNVFDEVRTYLQVTA